MRNKNSFAVPNDHKDKLENEIFKDYDALLLEIEKKRLSNFEQEEETALEHLEAVW